MRPSSGRSLAWFVSSVIVVAILSLTLTVRAYDFDVVVYGSTPAGIAAATVAGRLGMDVAIFEPLPMIGGMGAAGNLGLHDGRARTPLSGLAREFALLNAAQYNVTGEVAQPESFIANASFYEMLESAGVSRIALDCRLTGVAQGPTGSIVESISVLCESDPVSARVFIDASYDGDIMVKTVDYTHGREAMSAYNESLAGAQIPVHGSVVVDALTKNGTIIPYVQNVSNLPLPGEADEALMAFQHRLCISGDDERLPWKKPKGYNRDDFILFERYIEANGGTFDGFRWPPQDMHLFGYPGPKKKYTLCCGVSIVASDQPDLNRGWATASWQKKQKIIADHTYFELGMFYFLANDPKVPREVRDRFNQYGICPDEFVEFDHIPPQLYIRESNRLIGDFVLTQNNIAKPRRVGDSIATADWWLDMHMTGKYAVPTGFGQFSVQLEGNFPLNEDTNPPPYEVPYRLMIPKAGTGTNLLVPVCLSTSHVAFASTRIESMLMGTGSAAGVAALQLVDGTADTVQEVNVTKVQEILTTIFQQVIHVKDPLPPSHTAHFDSSEVF